jgi:hypothetical protein
VFVEGFELLEFLLLLCCHEMTADDKRVAFGLDAAVFEQQLVKELLALVPLCLKAFGKVFHKQFANFATPGILMSLLERLHKFAEKLRLISEQFFLFHILAIPVLIIPILNYGLLLDHGADSNGLRVHFVQALYSRLL